jgi:hypothetical protein
MLAVRATPERHADSRGPKTLWVRGGRADEDDGEPGEVTVGETVTEGVVAGVLGTAGVTDVGEAITPPVAMPAAKAWRSRRYSVSRRSRAVVAEASVLSNAMEVSNAGQDFSVWVSVITHRSAAPTAASALTVSVTGSTGRGCRRAAPV